MEQTETIDVRYRAALHELRQRIVDKQTELEASEIETRTLRAELKKLRTQFWDLTGTGPDPQLPLEFQVAGEQATRLFNTDNSNTAPTPPFQLPAPKPMQLPAPVLPAPVMPTARDLVGGIVPKSEQLWRKRDIREMTDHIPLINALYGVPLETIGALYDFLDEDRSLIAAGGFKTKLNKLAINSFVDYCEAHPEIEPLLNVERM